MTKSLGDVCYAAVLLPFTPDLKVDEAAYRKYLQYFLKNERFRARGGLCINPEAGEIFTLTREEKRRVLEIAMEENNHSVPLIAGTWALATSEVVDTARDAKAMGVDGIFVTPLGGAQDIPHAGTQTNIQRSGPTKSKPKTGLLTCPSSRTRSRAQPRPLRQDFLWMPLSRFATRSQTSSAGR